MSELPVSIAMPLASPVATPLERLGARQLKEQVFAQAKREQLTPLQAERAQLLKNLDNALQQFMAGALPSLKPEVLTPFEQAVKDNFLEVGPTALAENLRAQSTMATKLCQRYEKEFNIYHMAEYLPDTEKKLAEMRASLADTQRSYERLDAQLEPLASLNERLGQQGLMPITLETAPQFTRTTGLSHYVRYMRDSLYRKAYPTVAAIESHGVKLAQALQQRIELQQELLIREQHADVQAGEALRQRNWVEAYVTAWTSRLSEKQILAEVQQAMVDLMYEAGFRTAIAARFERRYPLQLNSLFDQVATIDSKQRRFLLGFDGNYEAGRIAVADESAQRQRTASSV